MPLHIVKSASQSSEQKGLQQAIEQHSECSASLKQGYQLEAKHLYTDKDGKTLFYRVRFKHPDTKEKFIRPVRRDGDQWVWLEPDFPKNAKPIYNLHEIHSNPKANIIVCEGEWAADKLNEAFKKWGVPHQYIATTSGGASSAGKADWQQLAGREVVIWPDNDETGVKYADDVTKHLVALNCNVERVDIGKIHLPEKADAVDWLSQEPQASFEDFTNLPRIFPQLESGGAEQKPLSNFVLSATELITLKLPELEYIVFPFVAVQSLIMVFAKRGIGKTWFSLQLAISVAQGKPFYVWDVPKPRRVLFIDGEMPLAALQYRVKELCVGEFPELLDFLPSQLLWQNGQSLNLNDEMDLGRIDSLLDTLKESDKAPQLIIIDNLSSMSAGVDENGNSDMDTSLRWMLKLRSQGYCVLLVHHAGKNGDQRGGSRREDFLDTSIKLDAGKPAYVKEAGANFNIEFVKCRGLRPIPDKLNLELVTDGQGCLEWKTGGAEILPAYLETLRLIRDYSPKTQAELAKAQHITASAVSQQLKTARQKGFLEMDKLELTSKGKDEVDKYFEGSNQNF